MRGLKDEEMDRNRDSRMSFAGPFLVSIHNSLVAVGMFLTNLLISVSYSSIPLLGRNRDGLLSFLSTFPILISNSFQHFSSTSSGLQVLKG